MRGVEIVKDIEGKTTEHWKSIRKYSSCPRRISRSIRNGDFVRRSSICRAILPFYKKMFAAHKINPFTIQTLEDLRNLPVTTKKDLQLYGPDFMCVTPDKVIDYATTSGTLGDPVTFTETEADLQHLAYNEQLSFQTAGCTANDIMQEMVTIDRRFMAGLAYFLGARDLGMGVVRVGNGIPELQWDTIYRIHPTVGMAVPSFLVKLIAFAEEHGIDYRNWSMKKCDLHRRGAARSEDNLN